VRAVERRVTVAAGVGVVGGGAVYRGVAVGGHRVGLLDAAEREEEQGDAQQTSAEPKSGRALASLGADSTVQENSHRGG
jgi:hypothetical protein